MDANFVPKDGHVTKYQNLANSKWRTTATLKNRFWLYPSDIYCPINGKFGTKKQNHVQTQAARDHNTKFRKFQMADSGHLKMMLSLCLSRESYYSNEICYANSNFVPRRSHDKVSEFIKFKSHM